MAPFRALRQSIRHERATMNAKDLIDELSKYPPHTPVKVLLGAIYGGYNDAGQFVDDMEINLTISDATDAYDVRYEGTYVLIKGE